MNRVYYLIVFLSVPIHVEMCVIHAEILTIAHVLSTTHVHSLTFFRTEKKIFSSDHIGSKDCYFDQFPLCHRFLLFFYPGKLKLRCQFHYFLAVPILR